MSATFDVAVIGAGIAGVAAALAAQERGARTCVVRAAPGASALASGAWSGPLRAELRAALAAEGFTLESVSGPLAHERGHTVTCDFAAPAHARAVIDANAIVCGIYGFPHFNAQTLARLWKPAQPLAALTIRLADTPAAGWTSLSLAAHIERDPDGLAHLLPRGRPVIMPAVLGVERTSDVLAALTAADIQSAEALAATPSIPGWRLNHALDRVLGTRNIPVFAGRARASSTNARSVTSIMVADRVISARSFVLATGKFTGGGISANAEFRENVFDAPVWLEQFGDVFTAADTLTLTDPVRTEPQTLLAAGVFTDERGRPIDRAGAVVCQNVFAAGTVRAGWHAAHAGLGHCAEDGWNAGVNAST